jgi:hypothetical protein
MTERPSPTPTPDRRQTLWVDPRFQSWFLVMTGGVGAITVTALWFAKWMFLKQYTQLAVTLNLPQGHPYFGFLATQSEALNWIMASVGGVGLLATSLWGIVLSHRIAGPILRLTRELEQMKTQGKLHPVNTREGDCFPELYHSFNQLAAAPGKTAQPPATAEKSKAA